MIELLLFVALSFGNVPDINVNIDIDYYTTVDIECMTEAMYFESTGEPDRGIVAVGNVIVNRMNDKYYPDSICDVIHDPAQFSYYWDGKSDVMHDKKLREQMRTIASRVLLHDEKSVADNVLNYHATYVNPSWAKDLKEHKLIGNHMFYEK